MKPPPPASSASKAEALLKEAKKKKPHIKSPLAYVMTVISGAFVAPIGLIIFWIIPLPASAHSGGTDASGCHNNRATGSYHCHGGGSSQPSSPGSYQPSSPGRNYGCRVPSNDDIKKAARGIRVDLSKGNCVFIANPNKQDGYRFMYGW
jgi:hypothetical protein